MNNHNLLSYYKQWHINPVSYKYKLCLIAFKIVNNLAPNYLTNTNYRPLRENLRIGSDGFILNSKYPIQNTISHNCFLE